MFIYVSKTHIHILTVVNKVRIRKLKELKEKKPFCIISIYTIKYVQISETHHFLLLHKRNVGVFTKLN